MRCVWQVCHQYTNEALGVPGAGGWRYGAANLAAKPNVGPYYVQYQLQLGVKWETLVQWTFRSFVYVARGLCIVGQASSRQPFATSPTCACDTCAGAACPHAEHCTQQPLPLSRPMHQALDSILTLQELFQLSKAQVLLSEPCGRILEGSTSNFFAVVGGSVHTAGEGVLEGTVSMEQEGSI